jgi:hypothetical protein
MGEIVNKSTKRRARPGTATDPRPLDADRFRDITIHDRLGADRRRPRAVVYDGWSSYFTIDIQATVTNNAASICHPVIRRAIEKWERDARARYLVRGGNGLADLAEHHLERLCAALLKGVRSRTTSPQTALVVSEVYLETECGYLKAAWELMKEDEPKAVKQRDGSGSLQLLALIQGHLDSIKKGPGYEIDQIMFYLKSEQGKTFLGTRKSWLATRGAYRAWRLKSSDVARTYRHRAKEKTDWPDCQFLEAAGPGRDRFIFPLPHEAENLPLVHITQQDV